MMLSKLLSLLVRFNAYFFLIFSITSPSKSTSSASPLQCTILAHPKHVRHERQHTPTWTVELISAAKPPVTGASWLMSKRPVFTTDWRKEEEEGKKKAKLQIILSGNMAFLKTKTTLTNCTPGETAVRRRWLQSTKPKLHFGCSGGTKKGQFCGEKNKHLYRLMHLVHDRLWSGGSGKFAVVKEKCSGCFIHNQKATTHKMSDETDFKLQCQICTKLHKICFRMQLHCFMALLWPGVLALLQGLTSIESLLGMFW